MADMASISEGLDNTEYRNTESSSDVNSIDTKRTPLGEAKKKAGTSKSSTAAGSKNDSKSTNKIEKARSTKPAKTSPPPSTSTHASSLRAANVQRAKSTDSRSLVGTPSGVASKHASPKTKQNATPQSKPVSDGTPLAAQKSKEISTENASKPPKTPGKAQKPVSTPQPVRPTKSTAVVKQEAKKSPLQDKIDPQKDKKEPLKAAPKSSSSVAPNPTMSAVKKSVDGKSTQGASEANQKFASKSVRSKATSPPKTPSSKEISEKLPTVNKAQQTAGSASRNPTTMKAASTPKKLESAKTVPAADKKSTAKSTAVSKAKSPFVSKAKAGNLPEKAEKKKLQAVNKTVANDNTISDAIQHAPDSLHDALPDTAHVEYGGTDEILSLQREEVSIELDEMKECIAPHASQESGPSGNELSAVRAIAVEEEPNAEVREATEDEASVLNETSGANHPEGSDEASTTDDYAKIVVDEDADKNNCDQDTKDAPSECESLTEKCEETVEVNSYQEYQQVQDARNSNDAHFFGEIDQDGDGTKPSEQTESIPIEVARQEVQEKNDWNTLQGKNEHKVEESAVEGEKLHVVGSDTCDEKDVCVYEEEAGKFQEEKLSEVSLSTNCLEEIPDHKDVFTCEEESARSPEEDPTEEPVSYLEGICDNKQPYEGASVTCQEDIPPELAASNTSEDDICDAKNAYEHGEEFATCQEADECKEGSVMHQEDDASDELNNATCPVDLSDQASAYECHDESANCQEHTSHGASTDSTCLKEDLFPCHPVTEIETAEPVFGKAAQNENLSDDLLINEEPEERNEDAIVQMAGSGPSMGDKEVYVSEETRETHTLDQGDINIHAGQADDIEIDSLRETTEEIEGVCEAKEELGVQCSGLELDEFEHNDGDQHQDGQEFCEQGEQGSIHPKDASISVGALDSDSTISPEGSVVPGQHRAEVSSISEDNFHYTTGVSHDGECIHDNSMNQKSSMISHVVQVEYDEKPGDSDLEAQETNSIETNTVEVYEECPTDVSKQHGQEVRDGEDLNLELGPTEGASDDQVGPNDSTQTRSLDSLDSLDALSHPEGNGQEAESMVGETERSSGGKDSNLDNDGTSDDATDGLPASPMEAGLQEQEPTREFSANQDEQLSEETRIEDIDDRDSCAGAGLKHSQKSDDITFSTFTIEDKMAVVKEFADFDQYNDGQVSHVNEDEVGKVSYSNAEVVGNLEAVTYACLRNYDLDSNETDTATSLDDYSHDSNNLTRIDAESPKESPVQVQRSESDLEPSHEKLDIAYDSTTPLSDIGIEFIPGSTVVQFKSDDVCDVTACEEEDGRHARLDFASSSSLAKSGHEPEDLIHSSDECQEQIEHEVCASTKSDSDKIDVLDKKSRPLYESTDGASACEASDSYLDYKTDLDLAKDPDTTSWTTRERMDLQDDKESFTAKMDCPSLDEYAVPYKQQKLSEHEASLENSSCNLKDLAYNPETSADEKVVSYELLKNENVKEFADQNTADDGLDFSGNEGFGILDINAKFHEDRQKLLANDAEQIIDGQSTCRTMDPNVTEVAVVGVLIASDAEPSTEHNLISDAEAKDVVEVHTDISEILSMPDASASTLECEEEADLFRGASESQEESKDRELPGHVDEHANEDLSDVNENKQVISLNDGFEVSVAAVQADHTDESPNNSTFQVQWSLEEKFSSQEEGITGDCSHSCFDATRYEKVLQTDDKDCGGIKKKDEVAWLSTGPEKPEDAIAFQAVVSCESFDYASRFIASHEEGDFKNSDQSASFNDSMGVRSADVELLPSSEVDDGIIIDADASTESTKAAYHVDGRYKMGSFGGPTIVADVSSDSDIEEDSDAADYQEQYTDDHHKYAHGFTWSAPPCYSSKHNAEGDLDGTRDVRDDCVESSAHDPFSQINAAHAEIPNDSPFHVMEEHGRCRGTTDEQTDY